MPRTDVEEFVWLELQGWKWSGRRVETARRMGLRKTARNRFRRMNQGDQTAIVQHIRAWQVRCQDWETARAQLVDEPLTFLDANLNDEYLNSLRIHLMEGLQTQQAVIGLRAMRGQHPRSDITVAGLRDAEASCKQRTDEIQAALDEYEGRLEAWQNHNDPNWVDAEQLRQHPGGSPPASDVPDPNNAPAVPPAPTPSWLGPFPLAVGGQATPAVYVRQNRHGHLIDRVCIKDTRWPAFEEDDGLVERPSLWDPDVDGGDDPNEKQPAEIGALERLRDTQVAHGVLRLRNWHRVWRDERVVDYRTYTEWCGYGDLFQLSRKYTPYGDSIGKARPEDHNDEDWLPESFLWACFEHLTDAGLLMEGRISGVTNDGWPKIIHRDLKPQNIFLTNNTTDIYKGYPQIKVGDWGLTTIISNDEDRVHPGDQYIGIGTDRCQAPEQLKAREDGTHNLSGKTNVWGIGIIMWALMNSQRHGNQFYTDERNEYGEAIIKEPRDANFTAEHNARYSFDLRILVFNCLALMPEQRSAMQAVKSRILLATNPPADRPDWDRSDGLRLAAKDDPRFFGDLHGLKLSEERFAMYSLLARVMDDAPRPQRGPADHLTGDDTELFGGISAGGRVDEV